MSPPFSADLVGDAPQAAALVLAELMAVRQQVSRDAQAMVRHWKATLQREEFVPSAHNLASYLALRKTDLRSIQDQLSQLGLSSLGRSEAHVRASLDAVIASLARIAGKKGIAYPHPEMFAAGKQRLLDRQAGIFGADPQGPSTRIMVTLPSEAATDYALVRKLFANGADVARINCAHDDKEAWARMIAHVKKAAAELTRDVRILMDLGGPKIRIAEVAIDKNARLKTGDRFVVVHELAEGEKLPQVALSYRVLLDQLKPDAELWINDGKIGAKVLTKEEHRAVLEVIHARKKGERLKTEKGVNVPGCELAINPLTERDLADLDFVAQHADIIGYSFVQRPKDVRLLQAELKKRLGKKAFPALMLKIETPLAVRNLPRLIVQAGGKQQVAVMIARGDLAVEIGLARLSEMQEQILWLCEAAHVPVVWATQVLDTLVKHGLASRGETTDAAMGQRAECVMLNKGPRAADAVSFLDGILRRMDRHQNKKSARLGPLRSWRDVQSLK